MAEELTIAIVVLVGLLVVIGLFLIFGNANTNLISSSSDSSNNINFNNQAKQADYALDSSVENSCSNTLSSPCLQPSVDSTNLQNSCSIQSPSSPCFQYQNQIQEKNNGIDTRPEQLKVEPCQELPKKCEVCFDSPEQTKGNGENDYLEQARKNC